MAPQGSVFGKLVKTAVVGVGMIGFYKMFVPNEKQIQKYLESNYGHANNDLGKLQELSRKGYSYEAICRIIKAEKMEQFEEQKKKEAEERLLRGDTVDPDAVMEESRSKGKIYGYAAKVRS